MTFVYGTGTNGTVGDNGNLQSQTIAVPTLTNTQSYAYDGVNRLSTFTEAATVLQGYSYDSAGIGYGNRWISSGTFIPYSTQTPQSNNFTNNRWASSTNGYDTAGNQTSVFLGSGGTRTFTYDAENRQIAASIPGMSAISYVYDGEGRRVQKTVGSTVTTFVYDAAGNLTAEYGPPSSVAGTTYLTADHLGSTRLVTNSSGAAIARYDYAPFGEELTAGIDGRTTALLFSTNQYPTTPDGTDLKFTGKERDAETGLDFFLARYYSSAQARFTSPDEFKGGIVDVFSGRDIETNTALPYADITDPQTLNKYGYVRNNPMRYTDPDGHCGSWSDCWNAVKGAVNYVKSVAYVKVEGGVGVGIGGKLGPVKGEVELKRVSETKIAQTESTKKSVIEIGVKLEVGPGKVGLAATGERLEARGDQVVIGTSEGQKTEWKPTLGIDSGKGKESGWDVGLGVSGYFGLGGGAEIGVNGEKVAKDIHDMVSSPPPPPAPAAPGVPNTQ